LGEIALLVMPMFFFMLEISPTLDNPEYATVSGGMASVFVLDDDATSAANRAKKHVADSRWAITKCEQAGIVLACTTCEQEVLFKKAQEFGIGCCYRFGIGGAPRFN
jgi:hypothetical protein